MAKRNNRYYKLFQEGFCIQEIASLFHKDIDFVKKKIKEEISLKENRDPELFLNMKEKTKKEIISFFRKNGYLDSLGIIKDKYC